MGGLFGGGGGGTTSQPSASNAQVFLPPNQGGAAQSFTDLLGGMISPATAIMQGNYTAPAQVAWPQVQQAAGNLYNNPYAGWSQQGATTIDQLIQQLYPGQAASAQNVTNQGQNIYNQLAALAPGLLSAGQGVSGSIESLAPGMAALGPGLLSAGQGTSASIGSLVPGITNAAFDPQQALYNQLLGQQQQQSGALAAQSGIAGTPYAQGLANQANQNLAMNWQNQQLGRETQGANTINALQQAQLNALLSGAQGDISATGAASALQGQGLQALLQGAQGMGSAYGTGLNALMGGATTGAGLQNQALQNLFQGYNLPYQTSIGQANTALGGTGQLINQGNQLYALPQQILSDLSSYMGLGQSASQIQGQLEAANQPNYAALGALGAVGSNALFGNQGLGGIFGDPGYTGNTGLLGALAGLGGGGGAAGLSSSFLIPGTADSSAALAGSSFPIDLAALGLA